MIANARQEHLECRAIENVLARMDLKAKVDAGLVISIEDRLPAPGELVECRFDQTRWPLRPRIEIGPRECARERDARRQAQSVRCGHSIHELLNGPGLPRFRIAPNPSRSEPVERLIIGGMHCDELALKMR